MLGHLFSFVTPTPVLAPYFHPVGHNEQQSTPRAQPSKPIHERNDSADSDETVFFESPEFPRPPLPLHGLQQHQPSPAHHPTVHHDSNDMARPKQSSIHALNAYFVEALQIPSDEAKRLDYYSGKESLLQKAHIWRRYLHSIAAANNAREPADTPVLEAARNVQSWAATDPPYSLETWDQVTRLHLALTGAVLAWRRNPRVRARILARNVRGLYSLGPEARFIKEGLNPVRVLGEMDQRVELAINSGPWRRHARRDNSVAACVQPMDAVVDVVEKMVETGWVDRAVLFPKGSLLAEPSHEGVKREYRAFLSDQMDAQRAKQAAGAACHRTGALLEKGGSVADVAKAAVEWPSEFRAWRIVQRAGPGPKTSKSIASTSSSEAGMETLEAVVAPRLGLRNAFNKIARSTSRDNDERAAVISPRKKGTMFYRTNSITEQAPPPMPGSPTQPATSAAAAVTTAQQEAKQRRILRPRTSNGGGLFRRSSASRREKENSSLKGKARNGSLSQSSTSTSASSIASTDDASTIVSVSDAASILQTPKTVNSSRLGPERSAPTKPLWTGPLGGAGPGGVMSIPF
ncbi:uncharacterized protein LOC62_04G006562 [Vanrija pseudolonga]|uniref:Uncharacterized protein n=1 Tax=Vanrija pseudolonga TaxID=143232 RepID=A0AAF0YFX7_9TREE|nr:hypothetical protein LOC62_04G006562 [Vanrija pseudolonga]